MITSGLPQERPERSCEVQSDIILHLYLVDAGEIELYRVLRGHDVRVFLVQLESAE